MKLWLDDTRPAPAGWEWAKTARDAIDILNHHGPQIEAVSLDHDLGATPEDGIYARGTSEQNGELVARHIAGYKQLAAGTPIRIHSWNPMGAWRMSFWLERAGYPVSVDPFRVEEFA